MESLQRSDLMLNCELLNTERKISKRLKSPLLKKVDVVIEDDLVFVSSLKKKSKFDTAIQMGFHILEKSKLKFTECFMTQLCLLQRKKKLISKFF
jgi:hypothetical protein